MFYFQMKTYYELILENPDWYTKTAPDEKRDLLDKDIRYILPTHDKKGRPIYVVKLGECNDKNY